MTLCVEWISRTFVSAPALRLRVGLACAGAPTLARVSRLVLSSARDARSPTRETNAARDARGDARATDAPETSSRGVAAPPPASRANATGNQTHSRLVRPLDDEASAFDDKNPRERYRAVDRRRATTRDVPASRIEIRSIEIEIDPWSIAKRDASRASLVMPRVAELVSYPVKSCAGVSLSEVALTSTGLAFDRLFCVVGTDDGTYHLSAHAPAFSARSVRYRASRGVHGPICGRVRADVRDEEHADDASRGDAFGPGRRGFGAERAVGGDVLGMAR